MPAKRKKLSKPKRSKSVQNATLRPTGGALSRAFDLIAGMPEDFYAEPRVKDPPQRRKGL